MRLDLVAPEELTELRAHIEGWIRTRPVGGVPDQFAVAELFPTRRDVIEDTGEAYGHSVPKWLCDWPHS